MYHTILLLAAVVLIGCKSTEVPLPSTGIAHLNSLPHEDKSDQILDVIPTYAFWNLDKQDNFKEAVTFLVTFKDADLANNKVCPYIYEIGNIKVRDLFDDGRTNIRFDKHFDQAVLGIRPIERSFFQLDRLFRWAFGAKGKMQSDNDVYLIAFKMYENTVKEKTDFLKLLQNGKHTKIQMNADTTAPKTFRI